MARPTPRPAKRKRLHDDSSSSEPASDGRFRDGRSAREQAKPYLLAVAHIPLDALDTTWTTGTNRAVNPRHVQRLRERFRAVGLERRTPENRIIGLCSAADVQRLKTRDRLLEREEGQAPAGEVYDFVDWRELAEDKIEVLAGQHRMAALRQLGGPAGEQWWCCELYDRARLPSGLDVQLRLNRTDTTLPDSHGQIWNQLMAIAPPTGPKAKKSQEKEVVEALRLGGEQFPTRRILTLYYNERWREMITRWCGTRLGQETFNISTCEWMSRLRVDAYWFETMKGVLAALRAFPVDERTHIGCADWPRLVEASRAGAAAAHDILYRDGDRGRRERVAGLLEDLTDEEYDAVAEHVSVVAGGLPGLERLTGVKKAQGQVMGRVLQQVLAWFDPASAAEAERSGKVEKRLLSRRLQAAIEGHWGYAGEDASGDATQLQADTLTHVREHLQSFLDGTPSLPGETTSVVAQPDYAQRFRHAAWAQTLERARLVAARHGASVLRPDWGALPPVQAEEEKPPGYYRDVHDVVQGLCSWHMVQPSGVSASAYKAAARALEQKLAQTVTRMIREANVALSRGVDGAAGDGDDDDNGGGQRLLGGKRRRVLAAGQSTDMARPGQEATPGEGAPSPARVRRAGSSARRRPLLPLTDDDSADDDGGVGGRGVIPSEPDTAQQNRAGSVARHGTATEKGTRAGDQHMRDKGGAAGRKRRTRPVLPSSSPMPEEQAATEDSPAREEVITARVGGTRAAGLPDWFRGPQSRAGIQRSSTLSRRAG